jgi:hypothetical protein
MMQVGSISKVQTRALVANNDAQLRTSDDATKMQVGSISKAQTRALVANNDAQLRTSDDATKWQRRKMKIALAVMGTFESIF